MGEAKISGKSLESTSPEISNFVRCSTQIGIYGLPRIRMYWGRQTRVLIVVNKMSRNQYFSITLTFKVVEYNDISTEIRALDRFWNIRCMLNKIQKA